jgi:hypothetical protein
MFAPLLASRRLLGTVPTYEHERNGTSGPMRGGEVYAENAADVLLRRGSAPPRRFAGSADYPGRNDYRCVLNFMRGNSLPGVRLAVSDLSARTTSALCLTSNLYLNKGARSLRTVRADKTPGYRSGA